MNTTFKITSYNYKNEFSPTEVGTIFNITSCNCKVKTSPTKIGTNLPFSFVAEISILAVSDMASILKIISCNCKVKTSPTEFGTNFLLLPRSWDFNLAGFYVDI